MADELKATAAVAPAGVSEEALKKAEEFTRLVKVNQFLSTTDDDSGYELLGRSPSMEQLRALIRKVIGGC